LWPPTIATRTSAYEDANDDSEQRIEYDNLPNGGTPAILLVANDVKCDERMTNPASCGLFEALRPLREQTPLPKPGQAWREPDVLWPRLVGQICAVGSSRSWDTLTEQGLWHELSQEKIRGVEDRDEAARVVHRHLACARVRYCSPGTLTSIKAEAIVRNAHAPLFEGGGVGFLDGIWREAGEPDDRGVFSHARACVARRLLVRSLSFFGPKSASDFLLGVGLADSLLAFDVRLLNLFVDCLGCEEGIRRQVHSLARYEELERKVMEWLAEPLGWNGAELDRVLFYHYADLKRAWSGPDPADDPVGRKDGAAAGTTVY
jgi:hypothetical protein